MTTSSVRGNKRAVFQVRSSVTRTVGSPKSHVFVAVTSEKSGYRMILIYAHAIFASLDTSAKVRRSNTRDFMIIILLHVIHRLALSKCCGFICTTCFNERQFLHFVYSICLWVCYISHKEADCLS
jgi:hypothetical protein